MIAIETIRQALQRIHNKAMDRRADNYMSVPADPKRDADLILSAAIDELEAARKWSEERKAHVLAHWVCAFCEQVSPNATMAEHLVTCAKHPMAALKAELAAEQELTLALTERAGRLAEAVREGETANDNCHRHILRAEADRDALVKRVEELEALFQQTQGVHSDWVARGRDAEAERDDARAEAATAAERQREACAGVFNPARFSESLPRREAFEMVRAAPLVTAPAKGEEAKKQGICADPTCCAPAEPTPPSISVTSRVLHRDSTRRLACGAGTVEMFDPDGDARVLWSNGERSWIGVRALMLLSEVVR